VTTTPKYVSGVQMRTEAVRKDAFSVMARLVEHYRNSSTDRVEGQWREPVASYLDPELWERELAAIHRTVPLALAMSCELTGPGSYKAVDAAGTPVIISRDRAGDLHAVVNACRHRGGEIVPEGTGVTRRFTCPYHAWSYDLAGLRNLPVAERAGIVFVSLTPGAAMDLDVWLGAELIELLEGLDLAGCYHHSTRWLPGPNWKVVVDGYLEGYHFASLHSTTVFRTNLSNMAAFDSWGPHQRNAFALRPIADAVDAPEETWDPTTCVGAIYWLFPGLAIAGGWREQVAVSLVLPGQTWDSSRTEQHILLRHEPADDDELKAADGTRDWFHDVVLDEDYSAGFGVQRGLAAMADQDFVFGRNEPGVQHFHRAIKETLA
jgi:phenylpropionate dioxygenase-like ring-hydroxylating dioxygenase large terminal subunit